jgi:hypothetical protein
LLPDYCVLIHQTQHTVDFCQLTPETQAKALQGHQPHYSRHDNKAIIGPAIAVTITSD